MEENKSNYYTYIKPTDFSKNDNYKRNYSKKVIKVSGKYNTILVLMCQQCLNEFQRKWIEL